MNQRNMIIAVVVVIIIAIVGFSLIGSDGEDAPAEQGAGTTQ